MRMVYSLAPAIADDGVWGTSGYTCMESQHRQWPNTHSVSLEPSITSSHTNELRFDETYDQDGQQWCTSAGMESFRQFRLNIHWVIRLLS